MGIAGACRCDELVNLTVDNVEDVKSALIITIPNTKTKRPRSFTVLGDNYLGLYRKYVALRPPGLAERRLFLRYVSGKCHRMVVGIHKISAVSQEAAKFLKLENWREYTGHTLRRTSATLLVDGGGDLTCLKRHGGWKSSSVAEGYIEDSLLNKENIAKRILQVDSGNDKPSTVVASDLTNISCKNFTIIDSDTSENNITINESVLDCSENFSKNESTASSSGLFNFNTCSNCVFNINVNKQ